MAASCDLIRRNPDRVRQMHDSGHKVFAWTVNHEDDLLMCHELGVDTVITDRPRFAREVLDAHDTT